MKAKRKAIIGEINITPLTDIFLVLLIIMMVVAPMLNTSGLKLKVPSIGPSADTKEEPKVTRVKIDAKGNYSISDEPITTLQLSDELKRLKDKAPDGVIIETSPDASHASLAAAMDAVQTAGVDKLAVTSTQASQ